MQRNTFLWKSRIFFINWKKKELSWHMYVHRAVYTHAMHICSCLSSSWMENWSLFRDYASKRQLLTWSGLPLNCVSQGINNDENNEGGALTRARTLLPFIYVLNLTLNANIILSCSVFSHLFQDETQHCASCNKWTAAQYCRDLKMLLTSWEPSTLRIYI